MKTSQGLKNKNSLFDEKNNRQWKDVCCIWRLGFPLHQFLADWNVKVRSCSKKTFSAKKCLKLSLLYSCLLQSIINFKSCLGVAINLDSLLFLRALHVKDLWRNGWTLHIVHVVGTGWNCFAPLTNSRFNPFSNHYVWLHPTPGCLWGLVQMRSPIRTFYEFESVKLSTLHTIPLYKKRC